MRNIREHIFLIPPFAGDRQERDQRDLLWFDWLYHGTYTRWLLRTSFAHMKKNIFFVRKKNRIWPFCRCNQMPSTNRNAWFTPCVRIVKWATIYCKNHALNYHLEQMGCSVCLWKKWIIMMRREERIYRYIYIYIY